MSIVKRNPMMPTVSKFFDDFFTKDFFDFGGRVLETTHSTPSINIVENENEFVMEVAAPGMNKEDFKLELNNNVLTIKSETTQKDEVKEKNEYIRKEFSHQSFQRSFSLNADLVDSTKINANYVDGILKITLPKKETAKNKAVRNIEIG